MVTATKELQQIDPLSELIQQQSMLWVTITIVHVGTVYETPAKQV